MRAALLLALLAGAHAARAAPPRILFAPIVNAPSHIMSPVRLAQEMLGRGYDIKILAHHADLKHYRGLPEASLLRFADDKPSLLEKKDKFQSGGKVGESKMATFTPFKFLLGFGADVCDAFLGEVDLQALGPIDLVVGDLLWECVPIIAARLRAPAVGFMAASMIDPFLSPPWRGSFRDISLPSSLLLPAVGFERAPKGALQVLRNAWLHLQFRLYDYTVLQGIAKGLWARHGVDFGNADARARHPLTILAQDPAVEAPRPLPNNIKLVGSVVTRPPQPLPQEFQDFIDAHGQQGFVVAAFGSVTGTGPAEQKLLAEAFSALPVAVLWKLSKADLPDAAALAALNLGPNVKVSPWLPQNDLLGHPQARAFLSHCGSSSFYESMTHGVPIVARPGFADQLFLAHRAVALARPGPHTSFCARSPVTADRLPDDRLQGVGVNLAGRELTPGLVEGALLRVLREPAFKARAEALSVRLTARARTPLQEAGDWLEHVLKTNGSSYLRPADAGLPLWAGSDLSILAALPPLLLPLVVGAALAAWKALKGRAAPPAKLVHAKAA